VESVLSFVAQVLRISVPYALAATGGAFSERGGVINIALEGMLLAGAFGAVAGTLATGSPWMGVVFGIGAGVLLASLHALVTVGAKADQILSGLALNLLALGGTRACLRIFFDSASNSPRIDALTPFDLPWLDRLGPLADLLREPLFLLAVVLLILAQTTLFGTGFGLSLRAAGDGPRACDGAGMSIARLRTAGILISGALGGLAGSWLAFQQHNFTDGMSGGRGYIALAAMIVGKWSPAGAALACLLFGTAETLQMRVPSTRLPTQFLQMLPYVVTLLVLAGWIGRARPPLALGEAYDREESR